MKKILLLSLLLGFATQGFCAENKTPPPIAPARILVNPEDQKKAEKTLTKIYTPFRQFFITNQTCITLIASCLFLATLPVIASYVVQPLDGAVSRMRHDEDGGSLFAKVITKIIATCFMFIVGPVYPNNYTHLNDPQTFDGIDNNLKSSKKFFYYIFKSLSIYPFIANWFNAFNKNDVFYKANFGDDYTWKNKLKQGAIECAKTLGVQAAYLLLVVAITAIFAVVGVIIDALRTYKNYSNDPEFKKYNLFFAARALIAKIDAALYTLFGQLTVNQPPLHMIDSLQIPS